MDKLLGELNSLNQRLNNEKFIKSAPFDVVEKTKNKKQELEAEIKIIKNTITKLS